MADEKIRMPSGIGGLVRYFDEVKSKINISPGVVIALCIAVIIIMIILNLYGKSLLGL